MVFDGNLDVVATADLPLESGESIRGIVAAPGRTDIFVTTYKETQMMPMMFIKTQRFLRFNRNAGSWSYGPNPAGTVVFGGSGAGASIAGGKAWTFVSNEGAGPIIALDPENLGGQFDAVASGGLTVNLGALGIGAGPSRDLAVYADGTATDIFWVDQDGDLFRLTMSPGPTATKLYDFAPAPNAPTTFGAVAMKGDGPLFVASFGSVYRIDLPRTVAANAVVPVPIASIPGNVYAGHQARTGSVVFASDASGVVRVTVP
jgi:hypothetical protein